MHYYLLYCTQFEHGSEIDLDRAQSFKPRSKRAESTSFERNPLIGAHQFFEKFYCLLKSDSYPIL